MKIHSQKHKSFSDFKLGFAMLVWFSQAKLNLIKLILVHKNMSLNISINII